MYIKKGDKVKSEHELLQNLPPQAEWPPSVRWNDHLSANTEQQASVGGHGDDHVGHMLPGTLQPVAQQPVPDTFDEGFEPPWVVLPQNPDPATIAYHADNSFDTLPGSDDELNLDADDFTAYNFAENSAVGMEGAAFGALHQQPPYVEPASANVEEMRDLNRLMSVTPVVPDYERLSGEEQWERDLSDLVQRMLGSRHGFEDASDLAFLRDCCAACIYLGQESNGGNGAVKIGNLRREAMRSASTTFQGIVRSQTRDSSSLTMLNFMRVLLDAYGHRDLAGSIMRQIRTGLGESESRRDNVIMGTIDFMIDTTDWTDQKAHEWLEKIDKIHKDAVETAGIESELAMSTLYNKTFVLLEADHSQEAFEILNGKRTICESVYGLYKLQTISWVSSLARAQLYTKQEISAAATMDEVVSARVEKAFSKEHPLYWLTKYRQGLFLLRFAYKNTQPQRRLKCWEDGENILRQVLLWRARILGNNNPQTAEVSKWLIYYLKKQGKNEDAATLFQWCQTELGRNKHHS